MSDETAWVSVSMLWIEMTKIFSEWCSLCSKISLRRRPQLFFPKLPLDESVNLYKSGLWGVWKKDNEPFPFRFV